MRSLKTNLPQASRWNTTGPSEPCSGDHWLALDDVLRNSHPLPLSVLSHLKERPTWAECKNVTGPVLINLDAEKSCVPSCVPL
jgi:hypothetical protein